MHVDFQILADGTDVTGNFRDRLVSLSITDEAGQKSDTAEIVIDDRDYMVAIPKVGALLDISLGFKGQLVQMGAYVVDDVSGEMAPDRMIINAKAADMLGGIKARKTRNWNNVTLGAIVDRIAGEHGLVARVSDSVRSANYSYLAQTSESDLNFLTRLARDLDAVAKPAGRNLVVVKRGEGKAADGQALPVFQVHKTQMASGSWKLAARGRYGRVVAEWGERGTAKTHKVTAGDKEPELVLRHKYPNEGEAQRAANAALEQSKRGSGTVQIGLGGFWGGLMAEAKVNLQGIKPELTGEWLITRVRHQLGQNLTTSFEAERDNDT